MKENLIYIPICYSVDAKGIIIDKELMLRDLEEQIDRIQSKLLEENQ